MSDIISSLRRAKKLSQEQLGRALADGLGDSIGTTYAQKKIARFESGAAAPTARELEKLAELLGVAVEDLSSSVDTRAPLDGVSVIDGIAARSVAGRSLMASCILSRPRPQSIDATVKAVRVAIEDKNMWIAAFVPFPSKVRLPDDPDDININNLFAYYASIRKSLVDSCLAFRDSLGKHNDRIALYFPRAELLKDSFSFLIPPIFRQFTLTVNVNEQKLVSKSLHVWTPEINTDTVKPVRPTGIYTLAEHLEAWECFFGTIVTHWTAKEEFLKSDAYWEKFE